MGARKLAKAKAKNVVVAVGRGRPSHAIHTCWIGTFAYGHEGEMSALEAMGPSLPVHGRRVILI